MRNEQLWAVRPPPAIGPGADDVGRWRPVDLAHLTADRRRLADALHRVARPSVINDGAVERLLIVFEELGSNALRHGRSPVQITVTASATHWLLTVSDAAVESAPTPAVDRDAAKGGLGLYLVARICDGHGWTVHRDRKVTWARIDYRTAEGPDGRGSARPGPKRPGHRP